MSAKEPKNDRADRTRQRILRAAIREFSEHGLAGARTSSIAAKAKVNNALLYYYFSSKQDLYAATLEATAGKVMESAMAAADRGATAGERLLRVALNHFDRVCTQHEFQGLMQQEMIRFRQGESNAVAPLVRDVFRPLFQKLEQAGREGIRRGELCNVDWLQMVYAALGANVFFFLSAPIMRMVASYDPFRPASLAQRRTAAVRFLGSALFTDRKHGAAVARRVLNDTPAPELKKFPAWRGRR